MATSKERRASNQDVFRRANEEIEAAAADILPAGDPDPVPFLCECPRERCTQVVLVTLAEYERVRSDGALGIEAIGHHDPMVENVVTENDRFIVTQKFGEAGDVVVETDPRG